MIKSKYFHKEVINLTEKGTKGFPKKNTWMKERTLTECLHYLILPEENMSNDVYLCLVMNCFYIVYLNDTIAGKSQHF